MHSTAWSTWVAPTGNTENDAFLEACANGNISAINKWIRKAKPLDFTDAEGRTPLMLAAAGKSTNCFLKILAASNEAELFAKDSENRNALYYACASDSYDRVKALYDKQVPIEGCAYEEMAVEFAHCPKVHKLLGEESNRQLELEGLILKQAYDKNPDDFEAMAAEVLHKTGKKIVQSSLEDYSRGDRVQRKKNAERKFFENEKTKEEVAEVLKGTPLANTKHAQSLIKETYHYTPSVPATKKAIADSGVTTGSQALRSKEVRKEIAAHFKKNPPASLKEASDYIVAQYKCKCDDKMLLQFLAYCGIKF